MIPLVIVLRNGETLSYWCNTRAAAAQAVESYREAMTLRQRVWTIGDHTALWLHTVAGVYIAAGGKEEQPKEPEEVSWLRRVLGSLGKKES